MQLKTTNLTESLSFIPMFCPPRLSQIICDYLILLRKVEILLYEQLAIGRTPESVVPLKEFFLVAGSSHIDPDPFGRLLEHYTQKYLGCRLGRRSWRHIAKAIKREYVPANFHAFIEGDEVGDQAAGHHSSEAARTYARVHGELAFLTTDRMKVFFDFSCLWHNALGIGSQPRPEAISLVRSRQSWVSNNNANRSISLSDVEQIEEAVQSPARHAGSQAADIPQLIAAEVKTVIEDAVKDTIQTTCREELSSLKDSLQKTIRESVAQFKAACASILQDVNTTRTAAQDALQSPVQQRNSLPPSSAPQPSLPAVSSQDYATPPLGQRWPSNQPLIPPSLSPSQPSNSSLDPELCIPSSASTSRSQSSHFHQQSVARPLPSASQLPSIHSTPAQLRPIPPPPSQRPAGPSQSNGSRLETTSGFALALLRKALGDQNAQFLSFAQEEMVRRARDGKENFICVIPTGGGKSALWNVPIQADDEEHKTTIVLSPYLSLTHDQLQRLASQNISAGFWGMNRGGQIPDYAVLFASYEHLESSSFLSCVLLPY